MASPQSPTSPKRSRGFTNRSETSERSGSTSHKRGPSESSEEKARRNLHTKADPLVAMNELQPMAVALEKSNLGSLRDIQHKDQFGNIITDPDLSNPTRPRLERPLDTIRSFEAAIYGSYSNRASYARTEDAASQMGDYSRRTSYYGGQNGTSARNYDQNNHYGQPSSRPDSIVNAYQNTPQTAEGARTNPAGPPPPLSPADGYSNIANNVNNAQYGYPQGHGYQRSADNVLAPSNGSGGSDPYGQSTDPSSLSSSNDQLQQQYLQQQRLDERAQADYGYNGYASKGAQHVGDPSIGGPVGGIPPSGAAAAWAAPAVRNAHAPAPPSKDDKRKSWFKRRFSKD
ncbi:Protein of unknown function DUF2406 [Penicillium bovifimosum]|uniref:Uncharacterized protein n=1 Tax=Penicillium bovifimosum TaxID=126998 RepID=A0A9W9KXJ6_9EURO|nr:Protein of unknown function DUF2406 [Penicillium bovifimosum]KAJ5124765.1 Protein of unknown function DUF2406 [Penicillium bovifimosum]